jgi:methyl-accepting chemotaxis protein
MKALQKKAAPQRRRSVVVDVKTQRALAMRMVLHCMLFMVAGAILASVNEYLTSGLNMQLLCESLTRNSYACTIVALLPLLIYDSMNLSNRIVGPICRLRDTIRKISRNEQVAPLDFRARDYWQEVPREFNAMIERLRSDVVQSDVPESDVPAALTVR